MIRVGILRGGAEGYQKSLEAGGNVISYLYEEALNSKYKPVDILVDKDGIWHVSGIVTHPSEVANFVDVVFNALAQPDPHVERQLDWFSIPHTGSNLYSLDIENNRISFKQKLEDLFIRTPKHLLFEAYLEDIDGPVESYARRKAREVLGKFPPPWTVRPFTNTSSMGIHVCNTMPELIDAFLLGAREKVSLLVEEFITGREARVTVLNNFRGHATYPCICLDNISFDEKREVEHLASLIHDELKLSHYSQTHFVITPRRKIYVTDIHVLPALHGDSHVKTHLHGVGSTIHEFLDHVISLALEKR